MRVQGDDRYSHVGIVVGDGGGARVHHAEIDVESGADGVVAQDVCAYLKRAERAALMRPAGLSEAERAEVAQQVSAIGHRPFNKRLQWEPEDGSVYCTQYVWLILERAWPSGMGAKRSGDLLTVPALLDGLPLRLVSATGG